MDATGGESSIETTIHTGWTVEITWKSDFFLQWKVLVLPADIYELLVQEGSVNHPDYEYFTGGIDDEFDLIWEEDEQFQAWYWELDWYNYNTNTIIYTMI